MTMSCRGICGAADGARRVAGRLVPIGTSHVPHTRSFPFAVLRVRMTLKALSIFLI